MSLLSLCQYILYRFFFFFRIQNGLSGAALRFFQREFTFFKKVTEISGIIRPFPKVERKTQCLKALQKVQLEPGRKGTEVHGIALKCY